MAGAEFTFQTDADEHFCNAMFLFCFAANAVNFQAFGDNITDSEARVETRKRILEDHLHFRAQRL